MLVHVIKKKQKKHLIMYYNRKCGKIVMVPGHMTRAPYLCGAAAEEVQD